MTYKTSSFWCISAFVMCGGALYVHREAFAQNPANGTNKKVQILPLEQGLFDLSQSARVNVLLDATDVVENATPDFIDPATRGPANDIVNVLVSYAQSYHLSTQRPSPQTFLFWPEADSVKIAHAVAQGAGIGSEASMPTDSELSRRLFAQLFPVNAKAENNQTIEAPDTEERPRLGEFAETKEFKLSELPQDLQQQLVASIVANGRDRDSRDYAELWFRDEVWPKVRVIYNPDDPDVTGTFRSLKLQYSIGDLQQNSLVSLDLFSGSTLGEIISRQTVQETPAIPVNGSNRLYVSFINQTKEKSAPPLVISDDLRPLGTAFQVLQTNWKSRDASMPNSGALATPISIESSRQPLDTFLTAVTKLSGIQLETSPEVRDRKRLIFANTQAMPLAQLMNSISQLYGFTWNKIDEKHFVLLGSNDSALNQELRKVGNFPWYRFREVNTRAAKQNKENFDAFATYVVDEAGPNILKPPGIAVSSLSPETQKGIRQWVETALPRRIVQRQIEANDLLNGQWSFQLVSMAHYSGLNILRRSRLLLLIDGKPSLQLSLQPFADIQK